MAMSCDTLLNRHVCVARAMVSMCAGRHLQHSWTCVANYLFNTDVSLAGFHFPCGHALQDSMYV